jgi:hypothetical protein
VQLIYFFVKLGMFVPTLVPVYWSHGVALISLSIVLTVVETLAVLWNCKLATNQSEEQSLTYVFGLVRSFMGDSPHL